MAIVVLVVIQPQTNPYNSPDYLHQALEITPVGGADGVGGEPGAGDGVVFSEMIVVMAS
jgi:hypothetical protein